jgi:hypothetical protein
VGKIHQAQARLDNAFGLGLFLDVLEQRFDDKKNNSEDDGSRIIASKTPAL